MVWLFATATDITELVTRTDGYKSGNKAEQQVESALQRAFLMDGSPEKFGNGYSPWVKCQALCFRLKRFG